MPSSRAWRATACAWLPALTATTPAARSASVRWRSLLRAPRSLNDATNCRFSNLTTTVHPSTSDNVCDTALGVRTTEPAMADAAASTSASVSIEDVRHRDGDALRGGEVEELVGAVRVRAGPEHSGDDELGGGEALTEHGHEGDRTAFADRARRLTERGQRGLVDRSREPWRGGGRVPSGAAFLRCGLHLGAVGRVGRQPLDDGVRGTVHIAGGWQTERQLHAGERSQHVAAVGHRGDAVDADDLQ